MGDRFNAGLPSQVEEKTEETTPLGALLSALNHPSRLSPPVLRKSRARQGATWRDRPERLTR